MHARGSTSDCIDTEWRENGEQGRREFYEMGQ